MAFTLMLSLCAITLLASTDEQTWKRQVQTTSWEIQLVRKGIETQLTVTTFQAGALIGCSSSCHNLMDGMALSFYYVRETGTCFCNFAVDTNPESQGTAEIYYGTLRTLYKKEQTSDLIIRTTVWPYTPSCSSLYTLAYEKNGVYTIDPTWCDMTNGGWTVIQRRKDGSENFYRGWSDYVSGFGNRTGEYWLGLENIHRLTENGSHLEIFLEAFPGVTPQSVTANYTSFIVGDSASKYTLHVAGFTGGSCGDSFVYSNGIPFSTYDYDSDTWNDNCAVVYRGAWWYRYCHFCQLNGYYYQPGEYSAAVSLSGIHWHPCFWHVSAKSSEMKIRSP